MDLSSPGEKEVENYKMAAYSIEGPEGSIKVKDKDIEAKVRMRWANRAEITEKGGSIWTT